MHRILVVDDDPSLVNLLKESLESEGFSVATAYDGASALAHVKSDRPDVLIMDVNMPGMNGPQALARLRQDPEGAHVPVMLLSGEAAEQISMPQGDPRVVCLEKPIDLDAVSKGVRSLLERFKQA